MHARLHPILTRLAAVGLTISISGCQPGSAATASPVACEFTTSGGEAVRVGESWAYLLPEGVASDGRGTLLIASGRSNFLRLEDGEWVNDARAAVGVLIREDGEVVAIPYPADIPRERLLGARVASLGDEAWHFLLLEVDDAHAPYSQERARHFWSATLYPDLSWSEPERIPLDHERVAWHNSSPLMVDAGGSLLYLTSLMDGGLLALAHGGSGWQATTFPYAAYATAGASADQEVVVAVVRGDRETLDWDGNSLWLHGPPPGMPLIRRVTVGGSTNRAFGPVMAWAGARPVVAWRAPASVGGYTAQAHRDALDADAPLIIVDSPVQDVGIAVLDDEPIVVTQHRNVDLENGFLRLFALESDAARMVGELRDPLLPGVHVVAVTDDEIAVVGVRVTTAAADSAPGFTSVVRFRRTCRAAAPAARSRTTTAPVVVAIMDAMPAAVLTMAAPDETVVSATIRSPGQPDLILIHPEHANPGVLAYAIEDLRAHREIMTEVDRGYLSIASLKGASALTGGAVASLASALQHVRARPRSDVRDLGTGRWQEFPGGILGL